MSQLRIQQNRCFKTIFVLLKLIFGSSAETYESDVIKRLQLNSAIDAGYSVTNSPHVEISRSKCINFRLSLKFHSSWYAVDQ